MSDLVDIFDEMNAKYGDTCACCGDKVTRGHAAVTNDGTQSKRVHSSPHLCVEKLKADIDAERAAKERLALELARADEERERLTKELEEARKPRKFPRAPEGNIEGWIIEYAYLARVRGRASRLLEELTDCQVEEVLLALEQLSNEGEAG